jgi:hypothetical protein
MQATCNDLPDLHKQSSIEDLKKDMKKRVSLYFHRLISGSEKDLSRIEVNEDLSKPELSNAQS